MAGAVGQIDLALLRRASRACFATGIYLIVSVVASFMLSLAEVFYLFYSYPYMTNLSLTPFTIVNFVFSCITVSFSLLFGYYAFRVGGVFNSAPLKAGAVLYIVTSVAAAIANVVSMASLLSVGPIMPMVGFAYVLTLLSAFGSLGLTIAAYVCLIIGASNMKNKTGVDSFNTAMILFILFFIPFVFPIGLIIFGMGLSKLASIGERKTCPKCGKEVEPYALFCKFCGAELTQRT